MKWRHAYGLAVVFVLVLGALVVLPEAAWAGPGGIFKAATQTLLGKIVLGLLCVIFAPLAQTLLFRRPLGTRTIIAVLIALLGMFILSQPNPNAATAQTIVQTPPPLRFAIS